MAQSSSKKQSTFTIRFYSTVCHSPFRRWPPLKPFHFKSFQFSHRPSSLTIAQGSDPLTRKNHCAFRNEFRTRLAQGIINRGKMYVDADILGDLGSFFVQENHVAETRVKHGKGLRCLTAPPPGRPCFDLQKGVVSGGGYFQAPTTSVALRNNATISLRDSDRLNITVRGGYEQTENGVLLSAQGGGLSPGCMLLLQGGAGAAVSIKGYVNVQFPSLANLSQHASITLIISGSDQQVGDMAGAGLLSSGGLYSIDRLLVACEYCPGPFPLLRSRLPSSFIQHPTVYP